jgi:hypothetical protein
VVDLREQEQIRLSFRNWAISFETHVRGKNGRFWLNKDGRFPPVEKQQIRQRSRNPPESPVKIQTWAAKRHTGMTGPHKSDGKKEARAQTPAKSK